MLLNAQGMNGDATVGRQPTCTAGTSEIMTGGTGARQGLVRIATEKPGRLFIPIVIAGLTRQSILSRMTDTRVKLA